MRASFQIIASAVLALGCLSASSAAQKAAGGGGVAAPKASVERIVYPSANRPTLRLPDGQKRIVHSMLNIQRPMQFGDFVWNDSGVPSGRTWVRVDVARQTLSVFRAGHEIGSTVILYGADNKVTPIGVFPVLAKRQVHRSSLYDAEMPFMLRLTGDGIAIHASNVLEGRATHGCIGVPLEFAKLLYAQMSLGDQVAIVAT